MSLARTALRLAVIEALNADPVIDGLCEGRIFDSRIGDMAAAEAVPVLVVYTEDDGGDAWSANNGGPPFDQKCDLLIEIAVRAGLADEPDMIGVVESDQELEAVIDLLEHRVVEAVTVADRPETRLIAEAVTRRVTGYKSMRFVSDETTAKLAIRMVHLATELKGHEPDQTDDEGPFSALPEPLRSVANSLPADSAGLATCRRLVESIVNYAAAPMLKPLLDGVQIIVAPKSSLDPLVVPERPDQPSLSHGAFGVSARPNG